MSKRWLLLWGMFFVLGWTQAQPSGIHIEGTNIVLTISKTLPRSEQQEILEQFGMGQLSLDSLWRFSYLGKWEKEGWKIQQSEKGVLSIYKPIESLSGKIISGYRYIPNEMRNLIAQQTEATFGVNTFRKPSVLSLTNGKTRFFYEGLQDAGSVFLSGTFNEWSTIATPMVRTDSGWVADMALAPGKHCYKFIIDGHWVHDLNNKQREEDGHAGSNSIYFVYNHTFALKGYTNAREVIVTGSFNGWDERALKMQKTREGWVLPVFIKEGSFTYKFIVDKKWITDPANPQLRDDGFGNINSLLTKGQAHLFTLKGYSSAKKVVVAGEFNNWNPGELKMQKTESGWELPYVLAAGNYQYKFIVDGTWMLDPANPLSADMGGEQNSLVAINPTHTFMLKSVYTNARETKVAGNFNGWTGYSMAKVGTGWSISLYVPPGKCLYKFIVDDQWIIDPNNAQWEENEFGEGNSVLWVRNQQ